MPDKGHMDHTGVHIIYIYYIAYTHSYIIRVGGSLNSERERDRGDGESSTHIGMRLCFGIHLQCLQACKQICVSRWHWRSLNCTHNRTSRTNQETNHNWKSMRSK